MKLYHHPRCSGCKKAIRWLAEQGLEPEATHDLSTQAVSRAELAGLIERSGLPMRRFFNTSGRSYREGGWSARMPDATDEEKLDALAADGMLVKRPILDRGDVVLVGFKPVEWEDTLV